HITNNLLCQSPRITPAPSVNRWGKGPWKARRRKSKWSLIEFWSSSGGTFQLRAILDAIPNLRSTYFSIKNPPWCNSEPRTTPFFNQDPSLMQFQPSCTLVFNQEPSLMQFRPSNTLFFQSRTILNAIPYFERRCFSIKTLPGYNSVPTAHLLFNQVTSLTQYRPQKNRITR